MTNAVFARAIASLEKKRAARQARWQEACATEREGRAERDKLDAFVRRYLEVRDNLARETSYWDADSRRLYLYAVLREIRLQRKLRRSCRKASVPAERG